MNERSFLWKIEENQGRRISIQQQRDTLQDDNISREEGGRRATFARDYDELSEFHRWPARRTITNRLLAARPNGIEINDLIMPADVIIYMNALWWSACQPELNNSRLKCGRAARSHKLSRNQQYIHRSPVQLYCLRNNVNMCSLVRTLCAKDWA